MSGEERDNRPGPYLSDSRALILILLAALFLLPALRRPPPCPEYSSPHPAAPVDQAVLPLLCFGRIDINHAGYRTLIRIPGIGPSRARAIIKLRRTRGKIGDLMELAVIRGIGSRTVGELTGLLTAGRPGEE